MVEGKVSSHIVELLYCVLERSLRGSSSLETVATQRAFVFVMTRHRGDLTSAIKDVENSISKSAMSPSLVSWHF